MEIVEIAVQDADTSGMSGVIRHACLDYPRDQQLCSGKLTVSGWLLHDVDGQQAALVITQGEIRTVQSLNVERVDVLREVLKIDEDSQPCHPQLACGFCVDFDIQSDSPVIVAIQVNGIEYPWKAISCTSSGIDSDSLSELWSGYYQGHCVEERLEALVHKLERLDDVVLRTMLFDRLDQYEAADILAGVDAPGLERCRSFLRYVSHEEFCIDAVQSATTNGVVMVPDPFGCGMAYSDESYAFAVEMNVLKFKSCTGEVFFLFQHVGSADAIYFPGRHAVVTIHHVYAELVMGFVCKLLQNLGKAKLYAEGKRRFLGLVASHNRPYHFYYDVAPSVSDVHKAGLLNEVEQIVYYTGGDFCSFKELYALEVDEHRWTPDELWTQCIVEHGYYFHVGMVFDHARLKSTSRFDGEFNGYARRSSIQQQPDLAAELLSCYPLVWFGITVQKRSWVEQVEAAQCLLAELRKSYPNVGVVFDGWTSPLQPTAKDLREAELDRGVVAEIVEQLDPGIKVFSVVGENSVQKILYGKLADVYVGNSATGGLHVSRFAGCPGVAHLNTQMIDATNHIRKRTRLVDKSQIIDLPESGGQRMDFISYSLDWRIIHDEVCDILEGASV